MSSSDLLQQAIVDATALKEAAIKNAATTLIEKYSQEFNKTVQTLLEQEAATPADPAMAAAPPPLDPAAAPTDPAAAPMDPAAMDPLAAGGTPPADLAGTPKDAFSSVPGSFSDLDDNKVISINFDQLEATLNEMLNETYGASSEYTERDALRPSGAGSMELSEEEEESEEVDLDDSGDGGEKIIVTVGSSDKEMELDLDEPEDETAVLAVADEPSGGTVKEPSDEEDQEEYEYELEEGATEDAAVETAEGNVTRAQGEVAAANQKLAAANKALADAKEAQNKANETEQATAQTQAGQKQAAQVPSPVAEAIELSEQELEELAEELKVDLKVGNLSDGYMGSTETQKREQRNVELAASRDMKAEKEREEEMEKMADLVSENKELKVVNNKLLSTMETLKLQLERMNISNAKLLYTNKALANISLNERQKNQIVESISKAGSVLEAKAVYEALQSTVESLEKKEKAPQSLSEALNRAATPFVVKKSPANSINDVMAERMKALAGIKK